MKDLKPGETIHQVRLSLYPKLEDGAASWSLSTIRYESGGRVPHIVTEQVGRVILAGGRSSWEYAEVLYDVLREITR